MSIGEAAPKAYPSKSNLYITLSFFANGVRMW